MYIKRLVVGGPSGTVVAIAAKRVGAVNIVLIEQFVYQGDMATDGWVILIPSMSYGDKIILRGIILEVVDCL